MQMNGEGLKSYDRNITGTTDRESLQLVRANRLIRERNSQINSTKNARAVHEDLALQKKLMLQG